MILKSNENLQLYTKKLLKSFLKKGNGKTIITNLKANKKNKRIITDKKDKKR
jgi:hypothetical protein